MCTGTCASNCVAVARMYFQIAMQNTNLLLIRVLECLVVSFVHASCAYLPLYTNWNGSCHPAMVQSNTTHAKVILAGDKVPVGSLSCLWPETHGCQVRHPSCCAWLQVPDKCTDCSRRWHQYSGSPRADFGESDALSAWHQQAFAVRERCLSVTLSICRLCGPHSRPWAKLTFEICSWAQFSRHWCLYTSIHAHLHASAHL